MRERYKIHCKTLMLLLIMIAATLAMWGQAYAADTNVVRGKAASCSHVVDSNGVDISYMVPYDPSMAVDGSTDAMSRWQTRRGVDGSYLQVDLGALYSINRWVVYNQSYAWSNSSIYAMRAYKFQKSTDGTNFTDVDAVTVNTSSVTDRSVTSFTARYLRVQVTAGTLYGNSNNWDSILEFEAYGSIVENVTISGNAGVAGATLSYTDGSAKTATADGSGEYSFTVSYNWSGTVTPSKTGCTFSAARTYTNVQANQTAQDYTATPVTYTISGNAGVAGATLSYTDTSAKTATADASGAYSFTVSYNWSGTVTPSLTGYSFSADKSYTNVQANQTAQDYTATPATYTISGNAGVAGATLSYTDGSAKTATADGSGAYSFTVSYNWSGTVTPNKTGCTFSAARTYTNVQANQTSQDYTATPVTYTISGNAGVAGATLSYTDTSAKTATADASGAYSFTVSYNWSGTVTPSKTGCTFSAARTYTNVQANQASQDYTATPVTYTISGNAGVAGATLSYTDGSAKTATADASGAYSFTVSYNWSGTVTPSKTGCTFSAARTYTNVQANQTAQDYTCLPTYQVATPTASVTGGAVLAGTAVTLSCTESGAAIYYTTDGNMPSVNSPVYSTTPINITRPITLKAIAIKAGMLDSEIMTESFTIKTLPTVVNPGCSSVTANAATIGGNVASDGGDAVTVRGIVYKKASIGTYTSVNAEAGGTGSFNISLTGLDPATAYDFNTFATNGAGTSYGEVGSFTTGTVITGTPALSAAGHDGYAELSWKAQPEAVCYAVYKSTAQGSYSVSPILTVTGNNNPSVTVTGSVYGYNATGLTNGTTYWFKVVAQDAYGYSTSSEASATPQIPAPASPTGLVAAAGNGQVVLSWSDMTGAAGYKVYKSKTSGSEYAEVDPDTSKTGTAYTVTSLTNGTKYYFKIKAINAGGVSDYSSEVNATPSSGNAGSSNSGSNNGGSPAAPQKDSNVQLTVNDGVVDAGTSTTETVGNKTVTTVSIDDSKIQQKLDTEGDNFKVIIPISNNTSDVAAGQLNGQTVKSMEAKNAVLEIRTDTAALTIPASQINIAEVAAQMGQQVELKDIKVRVSIAQVSQDTAKIVQDTANKNNYQIVVRPVEFEITCVSGNTTVEVSHFSGYVERTVAIPDGIDPSKITTGIVLNRDGTFSHVPTTIIKIDGKYYAKINSLTNSTYTLISSPKTFADVENHWAKADIDDMASRLVISGTDEKTFQPDRDITRAEFTAIIVRAMGLMRTGAGKDTFKDVDAKSWYYDAVSIAAGYKLISGYEGGIFKPDRKITREEAMAVAVRAMKIAKLNTGMTAAETDRILSGFDDNGNVSDWAKASVAACVREGIVSGSGGSLLAKDNISRAQTAAIIRRMLKNAGLIL